MAQRASFRKKIFVSAQRAHLFKENVFVMNQRSYQHLEYILVVAQRLFRDFGEAIKFIFQKSKHRIHPSFAKRS